ncbi:GNAT family N-acetyltransferase [Xanthobacter sp. ZOL 2024]
MAEDLRIGLLSAPELDTVVEWAATEGWNPGLADAPIFHAQDPQGFWGLFVDGALAVSLSTVRYDGGFAFVGFYICRPDLRGRGLGLKLWQAALAGLSGRSMGLDGVVAQQANYATSGFVLAHRNNRYGGPAPAVGAVDPRIVPVDTAVRAAVMDYDARHFGFQRPRFLASWLVPTHGSALALVEDGTVKGYGVIRACRTGYRIGPLFADDPGCAEALFRALVAGRTGEAVFLDVPEPNGAAAALAQTAGLAPVFETARMYQGPAPALPLAEIFGITSLELG